MKDIVINKSEFKPLGYGYNSLEPYIDAKTMELHHSKHHTAYYNKMLNAAESIGAGDMTFGELFKKISDYPDLLRNNAGGHFNHDLFWSILKLNSGAMPDGDLGIALKNEFGSIKNFKELFSNAAATRFGSGWAWLIVDQNKKLKVTSTANQDNPLMNIVEEKGTPILGLDVWEHAYYLKYQNRRPDYISAFWNVINWPEVSRKYFEAIEQH